ncbi:MAG TPA: hypothetical protein VMT00_09445 [Thermoanaerobaculia bacterium]|nr:hypothetical protein [Thermoanaerobaculia bacterium]
MEEQESQRFPRWAAGLIAVILILFVWLLFAVRDRPQQADLPRVETMEGAPEVTGPVIPVVTGTANVTETPADEGAPTPAEEPPVQTTAPPE